jgi:hypothetical protein
MLLNHNWFKSRNPAPLSNGELQIEKEASIVGVKRQVDVVNWGRVLLKLG